MGIAAAAAIGAVASVGGGLLASSGAKSAANTQAQAARDAQAAQERMFEKQIALQEPFRQGGLTAQNQLMTLLGLSADPNATDFGKYARDFGMQDYQADPGYAFRLAEGQKAIDRSAAARGGLQSGSALKAAARFGQDLGSQEYQNAFNRYQVNRSNQLNPLQSLMGAGQSAANTLTSAAGQQGQNQAANIYNAGQARASGYVGSANALSGALQGIGQMASQYPLYQAQTNYLNNLGGYGGGGYGGLPTAAQSQNIALSSLAGGI